MYLAIYFVDGEGLDVCSMPQLRLPQHQAVPEPLVYLCPQCGESWAKRYVDTGGVFRVHHAVCTDCGGGFLLTGYRFEDISHVPRKVLLRELSLIAALPDPLLYRKAWVQPDNPLNFLNTAH